MTGTDLSFGKARRILKNAEFRRIFKQGRRLNVPELTLVIQPSRNPVSAPARLGLSISRKVGGRFEPGADLVLVGRKETAELGYHRLRTVFLGLCERGKILRSGSAQ
jgi:RNase P protein component